MWSLDSNVLVDAIRVPEAEAALAAFVDSSGAFEISSIVAAELEFGARTKLARARLESGVIGALLSRGHVVAPSAAEWSRMGRLLSDHPEWARTASRQNDALLAVQCAERGWTLVTRDRDFGEFLPHLPALQLVPPFPGLPSSS